MITQVSTAFTTATAGNGGIYWFRSTHQLASDEVGTGPNAGAAPSASGAPETTATSRYVLVIEDNLDYAEGLQLIFELYGHTAAIALTGTEGVATALQNPPDVVICDIGLPEMDGFEVARTLRGNPSTAEVFLVAVTGYGTDADRRRAAEAGFDAHFLKPVDPTEILKLIESRPASQPSN